MKVKSVSHVWFFATPWTVTHQSLPSLGFSRQEYLSGLSFPSPGDRPDPGIEPRSPALQADTLTSEPPGKPHIIRNFTVNRLNFILFKHRNIGVIPFSPSSYFFPTLRSLPLSASFFLFVWVFWFTLCCYHFSRLYLTNSSNWFACVPYSVTYFVDVINSKYNLIFQQ